MEFEIQIRTQIVITIISDRLDILLLMVICVHVQWQRDSFSRKFVTMVFRIIIFFP